MYDFDLVVIGSGPAGEKGAVQAAYFGKKVALVEKEELPGGEPGWRMVVSQRRDAERVQCAGLEGRPRACPYCRYSETGLPSQTQRGQPRSGKLGAGRGER
jgi:heterodisulfide reductase subunit A-like polyferredoxin